MADKICVYSALWTRISVSLATDVETHILYFSGALGTVCQVFGKIPVPKSVFLRGRVIGSIINFCVQSLDRRWNVDHSCGSACPLRPCGAFCMQYRLVLFSIQSDE